MDAHQLALMLAGIVGSTVAVVHGFLTQRYMVAPLSRLASDESKLRPTVVRLVPVLLHFSTFAWLLGGLALIAAANVSGHDVRLVTCAIVGVSYLYGVIGNFWATRGRHPGWLLLAVSIALIVFSVSNLEV